MVVRYDCLCITISNYSYCKEKTFMQDKFKVSQSCRFQWELSQQRLPCTSDLWCAAVAVTAFLCLLHTLQSIEASTFNQPVKFLTQVISEKTYHQSEPATKIKEVLEIYYKFNLNNLQLILHTVIQIQLQTVFTLFTGRIRTFCKQKKVKISSNNMPSPISSSKQQAGCSTSLQ